MLIHQLPKHRSVSQLHLYLKCPMAYKLQRIDKVWSRPAAWLPQGTAFHTVAEAYEIWLSYGMPLTLDEAQDMFRHFYSKDVAAFTAETPNFDWWTWSGPYNGERDLERRFHLGMEQVEKFVAWRETVGQEIWETPDGTPAIELGFEIDLDGVPVKGVIDAVVVVDGRLRVRDYKTGKLPSDSLQLGVYAVALKQQFGVDVIEGDYFVVGKKGKKPALSSTYDLSEWTLDRVTGLFRELEDDLRAGKFDPDPEPEKCGFCDVSYFCPVYRD
ncbi:exonuclease [Mycobacterium phage Phlei]|uniref:PD-(D/E)XK endonuclease-like domain-containing protein n=1 Tax=Mycobacterium phage Phlei TaxID=1690684 RepID=A0A0N9BDN4_9CAUD|nr:exonuclease [Mycobacterium phage Phlei]ALA48173.1 hypothetical protein [Mycobacterium phage Phlei]